MPAVDPFLAEITRLALGVAERHGFALGGGNALVLHGVVDRPTEDVDLFTDVDGGVQAAAALVLSALRTAGLAVTEATDDSGLDDVIDDLDGHMIRLMVRRGGALAELSLSSLHRNNSPVIMDIGPVMHLDDLIAWKIAAIVNRREVRDYIDTAAFLSEHAPEQLLAMARRVDPGLEDEDVVMVGQLLDRMPDRAFRRYGLVGTDLAELRRRFAAWPR